MPGCAQRTFLLVTEDVCNRRGLRGRGWEPEGSLIVALSSQGRRVSWSDGRCGGEAMGDQEGGQARVPAAHPPLQVLVPGGN